MATLVTLGHPSPSEESALNTLSALLPDDWIITTNVTHLSREIDSVLVCDRALVVIELKNLYGAIIPYEYDEWQNASGAPLEKGNPLQQARSAKNAVMSFLRRQLRLPDSAKLPIWVDFMVVITGRATLDLSRLGADSAARVCLVSALGSAVTALARSRRRADIDGAEIISMFREPGQYQSNNRIQTAARPHYSVILHSLDGTTRIYYDDVRLGSRQLAGMGEDAALKAVKSRGPLLMITGDGVFLRRTPSTCSVSIGARSLDVGHHAVPPGRTSLRIAGLALEMLVKEISPDG